MPPTVLSTSVTFDAPSAKKPPSILPSIEVVRAAIDVGHEHRNDIAAGEPAGGDDRVDDALEGHLGGEAVRDTLAPSARRAT